jgi:hypothetical protein
VSYEGDDSNQEDEEDEEYEEVEDGSEWHRPLSTKLGI